MLLLRVVCRVSCCDGESDRMTASNGLSPFCAAGALVFSTARSVLIVSWEQPFGPICQRARSAKGRRKLFGETFGGGLNGEAG